MAVASAYILRCKGVLLVKALITLTAWLMLSLAVLSCAQPAPLATPDIPATVAAQVAERMAAIPTVAADPVATPAPTYTPYPTPTLTPTATPYPTATPRPTYTPYPTPTALPTYTPYPIPTPEPIPTATPLPTIAAGTIRWKSVSPRPHYRLEIPADWYLEFDEAQTLDLSSAVCYTTYGADVCIYSSYSSSGWASHITPETIADIDIEASRADNPGLRVLSVLALPSGERRTEVSLPGTDEYCAGLMYGRHILTPTDYYTIWVEVCDGYHEFYDVDFVDRLLSSFTYQ